MEKAYKDPITWKNRPDTTTPLNERNLNNLSGAVDIIDNRVIEMNDSVNSKLPVSDAANMLIGVSYDKETGAFTFQTKRGVPIRVETNLGRVATNWSFDELTQKIVLELEDGTTQYINLGSFITEYEFFDSSTIFFTKERDGSITADVKEGSIRERHLEPNYLAKISVEVAKAEAARDSSRLHMESAAESEKQAGAYATTAESFAHGGTGILSRPNEDTDNSKYYSQLAQQLVDEAKRIIAASTSGAIVPAGTLTFQNLPSSPNVGNMYNISNDFTTDSRFVEGAGIFYRAGANVYWTKDSKWDVMVGVQVTGVKGNSESSYRFGNVNLTPANIGAAAVDGSNVSGTWENLTAGKASQDGIGHNIVAFYAKKGVVGADALTDVFYTYPGDNWGEMFREQGVSIASAIKSMSEKLTEKIFGITPGDIGIEKCHTYSLKTTSANMDADLKAFFGTLPDECFTIYMEAGATYRVDGYKSGKYGVLRRSVYVSSKNAMGTHECACINGVWGDWKLVYTESYKPTPSDIRAAAADGSNVDGVWGNLSSGTVYGEYTQNGGEQAPGYIESSRVKFNMMRKFKGLPDIAGTYMDCMMMDCYEGMDVPHVTALGIRKGDGIPRAFIAVGGKKNNTSWTSQAELITTANYQNYLSGAAAPSNAQLKLVLFSGVLTSGTQYFWTDAGTLNNAETSIPVPNGRKYIIARIVGGIYLDVSNTFISEVVLVRSTAYNSCACDYVQTIREIYPVFNGEKSTANGYIELLYKPNKCSAGQNGEIIVNMSKASGLTLLRLELFF